MSDVKALISFVHDYYQTDQTIPLHAPNFTELEKSYLLDCIDSTFVSTVGEYVDRFEQAIADYTGAGFAVATVNGTSALHIALLLAGVRPGDRVICPSLTFVATANAIQYCGAEPLFVDVEQPTLGMAPDALSVLLKQQAGRIAACLPMHTFGHPTRIDEIVAICDRYDIPVVEDAAEALGSCYREQHVGTFGQLGILSFNGNKIITSGGGGMILTNDAELARRAKHLTTTAKVAHSWEFVHDEVGFNYRMPNLNAALGLAQLQRLPAMLQQKRDLADAYASLLPESFVREPDHAHANYWLNTIILESQEQRDDFLQQTNSAQIQTRPVWRPMHLLPLYQACGRGELATTEYLHKRLLNLPSSALKG